MHGRLTPTSSSISPPLQNREEQVDSRDRQTSSRESDTSPALTSTTANRQSISLPTNTNGRPRRALTASSGFSSSSGNVSGYLSANAPSSSSVAAFSIDQGQQQGINSYIASNPVRLSPSPTQTSSSESFPFRGVQTKLNQGTRPSPPPPPHLPTTTTTPFHTPLVAFPLSSVSSNSQGSDVADPCDKEDLLLLLDHYANTTLQPTPQTTPSSSPVPSPTPSPPPTSSPHVPPSSSSPSLASAPQSQPLGIHTPAHLSSTSHDSNLQTSTHPIDGHSPPPPSLHLQRIQMHQPDTVLLQRPPYSMCREACSLLLEALDLMASRVTQESILNALTLANRANSIFEAAVGRGVCYACGETCIDGMDEDNDNSPTKHTSCDNTMGNEITDGESNAGEPDFAARPSSAQASPSYTSSTSSSSSSSSSSPLSSTKVSSHSLTQRLVMCRCGHRFVIPSPSTPSSTALFPPHPPHGATLRVPAPPESPSNTVDELTLQIPATKSTTTNRNPNSITTSASSGTSVPGAPVPTAPISTTSTTSPILSSSSVNSAFLPQSTNVGQCGSQSQLKSSSSPVSTTTPSSSSSSSLSSSSSSSSSSASSATLSTATHLVAEPTSLLSSLPQTYSEFLLPTVQSRSPSPTETSDLSDNDPMMSPSYSLTALRQRNPGAPFRIRERQPSLPPFAPPGALQSAPTTTDTTTTTTTTADASQGNYPSDECPQCPVNDSHDSAGGVASDMTGCSYECRDIPAAIPSLHSIPNHTHATTPSLNFLPFNGSPASSQPSHHQPHHRHQDHQAHNPSQHHRSTHLKSPASKSLQRPLSPPQWPVKRFPPHWWRRCMSLFAVDCTRAVLSLLRDNCLQELRLIRTYREFWREHSDSHWFFHMRRLFRPARLHLKRLAKLETELVGSLGRLHGLHYTISLIDWHGYTYFSDGNYFNVLCSTLDDISRSPSPADRLHRLASLPPRALGALGISRIDTLGIHNMGPLILSPGTVADFFAAGSLPNVGYSSASSVVDVLYTVVSTCSKVLSYPDTDVCPDYLSEITHGSTEITPSRPSTPLPSKQGSPTTISSSSPSSLSTFTSSSSSSSSSSSPPSPSSTVTTPTSVDHLNIFQRVFHRALKRIESISNDLSRSNWVRYTRDKVGLGPRDATSPPKNHKAPAHSAQARRSSVTSEFGTTPHSSSSSAVDFNRHEGYPGHRDQTGTTVDTASQKRGVGAEVLELGLLYFNTDKDKKVLLSTPTMLSLLTRTTYGSPIQPTSPNALADPAVRVQRRSSPKKVLTLLAQLLQLLTRRERIFFEETKELAPPSHLRRHWVAYLCGTVAAGAGLYWAYRNQVLVQEACEDLYKSAAVFVREHTTEPLTKILQKTASAFYGDDIRRSELPTRQEVQASREELKSMLLNYGKENADVISTYEKVPKAEYLKALPQRAGRADMTLVMHKYTQDVNAPITNLGSLISGLLIQIQKLKADSEESMLDLDTILEQNEINFNVFAIMPAAVILGGAVILVQNSAQVLWRRSTSPAKVLHNLRIMMQKIEMLLIQVSAASKQTQAQSLAFGAPPLPVYPYQSIPYPQPWVPSVPFQPWSGYPPSSPTYPGAPASMTSQWNPSTANNNTPPPPSAGASSTSSMTGPSESKTNVSDKRDDKADAKDIESSGEEDDMSHLSATDLPLQTVLASANVNSSSNGPTNTVPSLPDNTYIFISGGKVKQAKLASLHSSTRPPRGSSTTLPPSMPATATHYHSGSHPVWPQHALSGAPASHPPPPPPSFLTAPAFSSLASASRFPGISGAGLVAPVPRLGRHGPTSGLLTPTRTELGRDVPAFTLSSHGQHTRPQPHAHTQSHQHQHQYQYQHQHHDVNEGQLTHPSQTHVQSSLHQTLVPSPQASTLLVGDPHLQPPSPRPALGLIGTDNPQRSNQSELHDVKADNAARDLPTFQRLNSDLFTATSVDAAQQSRQRRPHARQPNQPNGLTLSPSAFPLPASVPESPSHPYYHSTASLTTSSAVGYGAAGLVPTGPGIRPAPVTFTRPSSGVGSLGDQNLPHPNLMSPQTEHRSLGSTQRSTIPLIAVTTSPLIHPTAVPNLALPHHSTAPAMYSSPVHQPPQPLGYPPIVPAYRPSFAPSVHPPYPSSYPNLYSYPEAYHGQSPYGLGQGAMSAGSMLQSAQGALASEAAVVLDERGMGYLLLYVCIMEELITALPSYLQSKIGKTLQSSLEALKCCDLDVTDKLKIVSHLYRAYDFFVFK